MAGARPGAGPGQSGSEPDDARRNPLGCLVEQLGNVESVNVVVGALCMTSILVHGMLHDYIIVRLTIKQYKDMHQ